MQMALQRDSMFLESRWRQKQAPQKSVQTKSMKRESAASKHDDRVRNTIRPSMDSDSGDPVLCQARGKTRRPSLGVVGRNNPRLLPPPRQPPHETRFSFHENNSLIVKALENAYALF